jgi:nicotinamide phosphoribosyltransferase
MLSNPFHFKDFYKTDHRRQYAPGTTSVYANMTARSSRLSGVNHVISFILQYFIKKYLMQEFQNGFFERSKAGAVASYKRRLDYALGKDTVPLDHVYALHELGYLPVVIKALPEGSRVPLQVPLFTVESTHDDFFWLTNDLETIISATIWGPCTSATIAFEYLKEFAWWAKHTGADPNFVPWQGHDFSFRGMYGLEAALMSGAAHLLSFQGTDTMPAIDFLEEWYNANCETDDIGGSVPATEHSTMSSGGKESEKDTYVRLLTEVYPKGIVSIVSDTWDFWGVITKILPSIKDMIMVRDGKLVIRPDSGDPVKVIVGDEDAEAGSPERSGLIQLLWNAFGGKTNEKGFKVLDSHVGAIYGDSITLERQRNILRGLTRKGFASSNIVLGIGSFTYQYVTRDTFGFAIKATHCEQNGQSVPIFKEPKTDSKKNSHRGLIAVTMDDDGDFRAVFPVTREQEQSDANLLRPVFRDGRLLLDDNFVAIRNRVRRNLQRAMAKW